MSPELLGGRDQAISRLEESPLCRKWVDPRSGVESLLLDRRAAPVQQSFYFVNSSFDVTGRYFWFYAAFPPGGSSNYGRCLGVVDFERNDVRVFPETAFLDASPLIDPETAEAYWCTGSEIWKRSPDPDAAPELVNRLSPTMVRNRRPWRLATHLTFSADRRALGIDVEIGREWWIGQVPLDGSEIEIWQRFDRCHNHLQCSPVDPGLMLVAQDYSVDPVTGDLHRYGNRLWLARHGRKVVPIFPAEAAPKRPATSWIVHQSGVPPQAVRDFRAMHGHEWWSQDGNHVWYVHDGTGVERVDIRRIESDRNPSAELLWKSDTVSHAHCDASGELIVADCQPPGKPQESRVLFFNRRTGKEIDIVSFLPQPAEGRPYHIHPHIQFCLEDRLLCYTTTVLGKIDVAFTSVASLVEATS